MLKRLSLLMFVSIFVVQINAGDLAGAGAGKGADVVSVGTSLITKISGILAYVKANANNFGSSEVLPKVQSDFGDLSRDAIRLSEKAIDTSRENEALKAALAESRRSFYDAEIAIGILKREREAGERLDVLVQDTSAKHIAMLKAQIAALESEKGAGK